MYSKNNDTEVRHQFFVEFKITFLVVLKKIYLISKSDISKEIINIINLFNFKTYDCKIF